MRWPGTAWALAAVVAWLSPQIARATEIAVLADTRVRPYVEAVAGFKEATGSTVRLYRSTENGDTGDEAALLERIAARRPDLLLTVGQEALAAAILNPAGLPVVFCMALPPSGGGLEGLSGVTLAVSPQRAAQVVAALFPKVRRVGAVYDGGMLAPLVTAATAAFAARGIGFEAVPFRGGADDLASAQALFNRVDLIWMLPDRSLSDPDLMRFFMFASQRDGKPLLGPSKKFVRAGVLMALEPDPRDIGRQAAEMAARRVAGAPPTVAPARGGTVFIHSELAGKVGLVVPEGMESEVHHVR